MQIKRQKYTPVLRSPFYSDERQKGAVLHRYLDDQFIVRFTQQARDNQLSKDDFSWLDDDRFVDKNNPCLRLPLHRVFYVISCEACCNAPGFPSLDPLRIKSAGFVIRQQQDGNELRWKVRDGIDLGWQIETNLSDEPDEYHQLSKAGYIEKQATEPAYTGEKTYPLSPVVIHNDSSRPARSHNLLYGFVPLGGQSYKSSSSAEEFSLNEIMEQTIWPVGTYKRSDWVENDYHHSGHIIDDGRLQQSAAELFTLLFERFHILESKNNNKNAELINWLKSVVTYHGNSNHNPVNYDKSHTMYDYLKLFNKQIDDWLAEYNATDKNINQANTNKRLDTKLNIFLTEDQASDLRILLARRTQDVIKVAVSDIAEPRYQRDGIYFAKVFIRYEDEKGCEKIVWGPSTIPFCVASPFDPEANRPQLIQMPSLDDLKRGLANGAALRAPKSLADVIEKIKPDLAEPGQRSAKNRGGEGGWMYIFSIPIITIVAMILMMIVINLLNFIFRWIPWVILRIPIPK